MLARAMINVFRTRHQNKIKIMNNVRYADAHVARHQIQPLHLKPSANLRLDCERKKKKKKNKAEETIN